MRNLEELLGEYNEIVQYVPEREQYITLNILFEAYEQHKKEFGSFKDLRGHKYAIMMRQRQDYQLDCVRKYVESKKYEE